MEKLILQSPSYVFCCPFWRPRNNSQLITLRVWSIYLPLVRFVSQLSALKDVWRKCQCRMIKLQRSSELTSDVNVSWLLLAVQFYLLPIYTCAPRSPRASPTKALSGMAGEDTHRQFVKPASLLTSDCPQKEKVEIDWLAEKPLKLPQSDSQRIRRTYHITHDAHNRIQVYLLMLRSDVADREVVRLSS